MKKLLRWITKPFNWQDFFKCSRCNQWKSKVGHAYPFGTKLCKECVDRQRAYALEMIGSLTVLWLHDGDKELARMDKQNMLDEAAIATQGMPRSSFGHPHMLDTLVTLGAKLGLDTSGVVW